MTVKVSYQVAGHPDDVRFEMAVTMSLTEWKNFLADLEKTGTERKWATRNVLDGVLGLVREAEKKFWKILDEEDGEE